MRSFRLLFVVAAIACGPQVAPPSAVAPANCQPLPGASATPSPSSVLNDTQLVAEPLASPSSKVSLLVMAPEVAEEVPLAAAGAYAVHFARETHGEAAPDIEVALDDGRPRRLRADQSSIALGQLVAADAELGSGSHWLFAAPVLTSGLVPRPAPGAPRAGVARRFFIGQRPSTEPVATGAVWLRKPEGSYNGSQAADRVVFDVFVFSASGAPLETVYTVQLRGPSVSGQLRLPSPFAVQGVPSGDYRVELSALSAAPVTTHFIVNRELGGAP